MTQQAVERALGKLLTDENFRDRFFTNPEIATWEAGFTLYPPSTPIAGRRERRSAHDDGPDRSGARAQEWDVQGTAELVLLVLYRFSGTSMDLPPVVTRTPRSTGVERVVGTVPRYIPGSARAPIATFSTVPSLIRATSRTVASTMGFPSGSETRTA